MFPTLFWQGILSTNLAKVKYLVSLLVNHKPLRAHRLPLICSVLSASKFSVFKLDDNWLFLASSCLAFISTRAVFYSKTCILFSDFTGYTLFGYDESAIPEKRIYVRSDFLKKKVVYLSYVRSLRITDEGSPLEMRMWSMFFFFFFFFFFFLIQSHFKMMSPSFK